MTATSIDLSAEIDIVELTLQNQNRVHAGAVLLNPFDFKLDIMNDVIVVFERRREGCVPKRSTMVHVVTL